MRQGTFPRIVILVEIAEIHSQCAPAPPRSALWTSGEQSQSLSAVGGMLLEISEGRIDCQAHDTEWPGCEVQMMW